MSRSVRFFEIIQMLRQANAPVTAKISSVLPDSDAFNAPLHASSWNKIPYSNSHPEEFRKLIRQEAEIEIVYLDLKEETTQRRIMPIALFYYIDAIILVAWCKLRNGFRHFRIDRIQHWELTGNHFTSEGKQLREKWEHETKQ